MHRALVLSFFSSTFLVLTTLSGTTGDPGPQLHSDDSTLVQTQAQPQSALMPEDIEEEKRSLKDLQDDWNKRGVKDKLKGWEDINVHLWRKRGWKDMPSTGWGKRSSGDFRNGWVKRGAPDLQNGWDKRAWSDLKGGSWGKRDWSQFRGGWGKRYSIDEQMPNLYDNLENLEDTDDVLDENILEDDSYLKDQLGKRDWSSFKGSWGKRDPAWHNLKGLWGKRSGESKWTKLQGAWGKRQADRRWPDVKFL